MSCRNQRNSDDEEQLNHHKRPHNSIETDSMSDYDSYNDGYDDLDEFDKPCRPFTRSLARSGKKKSAKPNKPTNNSHSGPIPVSPIVTTTEPSIVGPCSNPTKGLTDPTPSIDLRSDQRYWEYLKQGIYPPPAISSNLEPTTEIQDLQQSSHHGAKPSKRFRYLFFYGHQETFGLITEACLSQFYPASFVVDGVKYPNAETYMMAQKAILFTNDENRATNEQLLKKMLTSQKPREVKGLGRKVLGWDQDVWAQKRFEIIKRGNYHKFTQNPKLLAFLLGTAKRFDILVEASMWDTVWGIGLVKSNSKVLDPCTWRGGNLLGFALTELRDELLQDKGNVSKFSSQEGEGKVEEDNEPQQDTDDETRLEKSDQEA